MDKLSLTNEWVTIRRCKISRLLFTDNWVLLASESHLQPSINSFAAACDIAEMKISTVGRIFKNFVFYDQHQKF